jgi:hypothetical protein
MQESTISLFEAHGIAMPDYLVLLNSIKEEKHLKKLVPSKFFGSIYKPGKSLFDLLNYTSEDLQLIKGFGSGKQAAYFEFRERMLADPNPVCQYYLREMVIVTLPTHYNPQETIAESIEKIIHDFVSIYRFRGGEQIATIVELYYGVGKDRPHDYFEIAPLVGLTAERTRQIIRNYNGSAVGQLFNEPLSICDGFQVHPELYDRVMSLKMHCEFNESLFAYFSDGEVIFDIPRLERLVEFFGGKISKYKDRIFLTNQIAYNTIFEEHFRAIEQVLKGLDCSLPTKDIVQLVSPEVKTKFDFNPHLVESILNGNPAFFNAIVAEDGTVFYEVPWIELASQALQVRRILLEAGVNLSRSEILHRYNTRCQMAGVETILDEDLYLAGREKIISYGNNLWGYGELADNRLTCTEFIKQYLAENGGAAHFDTVKNVLLANHYRYPNSSIRSYLTTMARVSIDDPQFFVLDDFISQFPNIRFRAKMNKKLGEQLADKVFEIFAEFGSLPKLEIIRKIIAWARVEQLQGNARVACDHLLTKLVDRGLVQVDGDQYALDNDEIQGMGKLVLRKEPAYRVLIRSLVIDYLKETSNTPVTLNKLKNRFESYLPSELRIQNFYKIFRDEQLFEKQKINGKTHVALRVDLLPEARTAQEEVEVPAAFDDIAEPIVVETRTPGRIIEREAFDLVRFDQQIRMELSQLGMEDALMNEGLQKFYTALKTNGDFNRFGRSLLQSIYDLWFSRTDYYDRESCIIKLTHGFETYIKILDSRLVSSDGLSASIRTNFGLSTLYEYHQVAKSLPQHSIDHQKRKFSKSIRSLLFYRNLYTHDNTNENLEMGLLNQISYASQFIALYVYAAAVME